MYARQLAWYASPAPSAASEKASIQNKAEYIQARGGVPVLPELGPESYLCDLWQKMGMAGANKTRLQALEIESWARQSGWYLSPFEFELIQQMSVDYVKQLCNTDVDSPAPFGSPLDSYSRSVVSSNLKSSLSVFKKGSQ